jgi:hypothetical protein
MTRDPLRAKATFEADVVALAHSPDGADDARFARTSHIGVLDMKR